MYVAAFIPDKGESARDPAARFPGGSLGEALHPVPVTLPDGSPGAEFIIDQAKFPHRFAADVPEGVARLTAVAQRPVTGAALGEPAPEPGWRTLPSWAVVATEAPDIPAAAQRSMAERAGDGGPGGTRGAAAPPRAGGTARRTARADRKAVASALPANATYELGLVPD
ncbi:hypothetical protein ACH3WN_17105 [Streptomyces albogriseolus]|uniref:hypothetical protein n=1 Tax=Streptomyces albogriseolus TaxID=1887 RepID=UPI00379D7697